MSLAGRRIEIRGTVQGVGFRPWVYRLAREVGIAGWVRNDGGGVTIEAFGSLAALDRFVARLRSSPPPAASIRSLDWRPVDGAPARGFEIAPSAASERPAVSIPADLPTCADCLAELRDPADRRYRYPFINCTNCGPRFTVARDVPYDRAATTMAPFVLCPSCRREYEDAADRRFHAEPNACPACGPRLRLLDPDGRQVESRDPIRDAARALGAGRIVALKGIGGFHLACDASSAAAVRRLRERKKREEKPLAVMVRDLATAERFAVLNPVERDLLDAVERPIVLLERRAGAPLADEVAPGLPLVGLLLPYSPLHHLLLDETEHPLVMTSGNLAEEPIAYRNEDALARLGALADLFVVHDREIETRADDSVVRVVGGAPIVLRRSRGFVPEAVPVAGGFAEPVLACGAHLKNTFCLGVDRSAYFGPHVGDLDTLETFRSYEESIDRMQRFLGVAPRIVAHDLHPDYLSTAYARTRPDVTCIGVQHHHAHVASVMAEHGLAGPVLGVAYDGTGYGADAEAWGGELLLADAVGFERLATFRPLRLAGGDKATRQVWRLALAALEDAFPGEAPLDFPLFDQVPPGALRVVRQMLAAGLHAPRAHGVGRYFDAIGALVLGLPEAHYEGQVALQWNLAAPADGAAESYPFEIDFRASPWEVDLRPLVRAVVRDVAERRPAALVSARFHATLAEATGGLVRAAARRVGVLPVVLGGGCFQNALLAERVLAALRPGFAVHVPRRVPPGDGGLALGQAVVAAARVGESF